MTSFVEVAAKLLTKQATCNSESEADKILVEIGQNTKGVRVVSFVNAHAVCRSQNDGDFLNALLSSDILFRDGSGMAMLMRQLNLNPGLNMNGTDLIPKLLRKTPRNTRIALFGTKEPYIGQAAEKIRSMGFEDILMADGFRPDSEYLTLIQQNTPSLIVLGMGMPKQERIATLISKDESVRHKDIQIINGGAILDFMSGQVPRAPNWMRTLGIEWVFRLLREPKRMLPRFKDSVSFALKVKLHKADLEKAYLFARKLTENQAKTPQ